METTKKPDTLQFLLHAISSIMENTIKSEKNPEYKHKAKETFNKIIAENKRLNKIVNKNLDEESIQWFDELTNKIVDEMEEVLKPYKKYLEEL